jgi:hypothetical protein
MKQINEAYKLNQLTGKAQLKASTMVNRIIKRHATCGLEIDMVQFETSTKVFQFDGKGNILEINN